MTSTLPATTLSTKGRHMVATESPTDNAIGSAHCECARIVQELSHPARRDNPKLRIGQPAPSRLNAASQVDQRDARRRGQWEAIAHGAGPPALLHASSGASHT